MSTNSLNHSKKITTALNILNEAAQDKKEEIQENLARFAKQTQKSVYQGGQKVKKAASQVDSQVHDNPWIYIGSVAAGAMLVGFLLAKAKRK